MATETQGEDGHVVEGAEIGVVYLQAQERQGLPGAATSWKRQGRIFPSGLQREGGLADTLVSDYWPPQLSESLALQYFVMVALGN